jgi:hypothetical protein
LPIAAEAFLDGAQAARFETIERCFPPVSTCERDGFRKLLNPSDAPSKKNLTRRANHRYIVIVARGEPAVGKLAAGFLFPGLSIGEFFASGVLAPFPDVGLLIRYGAAPARGSTQRYRQA